MKVMTYDLKPRILVKL